jgi:hypothetical protein
LSTESPITRSVGGSATGSIPPLTAVALGPCNFLITLTLIVDVDASMSDGGCTSKAQIGAAVSETIRIFNATWGAGAYNCPCPTSTSHGGCTLRFRLVIGFSGSGAKLQFYCTQSALRDLNDRGELPVTEHGSAVGRTYLDRVMIGSNVQASLRKVLIPASADTYGNVCHLSDIVAHEMGHALGHIGVQFAGQFFNPALMHTETGLMAPTCGEGGGGGSGGGIQMPSIDEVCQIAANSGLCREDQCCPGSPFSTVVPVMPIPVIDSPPRFFNGRYRKEFNPFDPDGTMGAGDVLQGFSRAYHFEEK